MTDNILVQGNRVQTVTANSILLFQQESGNNVVPTVLKQIAENMPERKIHTAQYYVTVGKHDEVRMLKLVAPEPSVIVPFLCASA